MKGYASRNYQGIPVGFEIRRQIGKDKIYRVRHGNGFYGSVLGELIQDRFAYYTPKAINNSEGSYARDFLREAVLAWKALSEADKKKWRAKEKSYRGTSGYALFISDYIRRNYTVASFIEDADKDTKVETEKTTDEDKIRFKTAGVDRGKIDAGGLETNYGFFHDRGDPTAYDFTVGDFITDGNYHTLDLSSIVPAGVKAVAFETAIRDDLVSSLILFRRNGNTNIFNRGTVRIQVANIYNEASLFVACDGNRIIEYLASNVVFTSINLTVKGWWK